MEILGWEFDSPGTPIWTFGTALVVYDGMAGYPNPTVGMVGVGLFALGCIIDWIVLERKPNDEYQHFR